MHKKYVYSSVFANLLNDYISAHREAGFMYDNPASIAVVSVTMKRVP